MELSIEEIKELIRLMDESDLGELRLESEAFKLRLRKACAFASPGVAPAPAFQPVAAPVAESRIDTQPKEQSGAEESDVDSGRTVVASPMVGTFYRAPSPEAAPYVQPGTQVDIGQPLCVIEAMKLFNEIESEVRGRIVKILVENGQPVEYGQALFVVEPDAPDAGV